MTAYTTLEVRRRGPVGWLIFDRPAAANAMDAAMLDELERVWAELDADPRVAVIVVTGNGPAFQTGLDMVELSRDPESLRRHARRTRDGELRITGWHCGVSKPIITAVNGICAGGGLHFVADSDVVLAATDAEFTDPHVSVGQVSALETIALARKVPFEAVMRMALTGRWERMSASRAYELGMVGQVVDPPSRLREEAQRLGERIARSSVEELQSSKRALWRSLEDEGSRCELPRGGELPPGELPVSDGPRTATGTGAS